MTCKLSCLTVSLCALAAASALAQDEKKSVAVQEVRQAAEQANQVKRAMADPGAVQDRRFPEGVHAPISRHGVVLSCPPLPSVGEGVGG